MAGSAMKATRMGSTGRIRLRLAAVFAAALLGQLGLPPPHASADCVLTAEDQHYIALLAQRQIGAALGNTDCDVAAQAGKSPTTFAWQTTRRYGRRPLPMTCTIGQT
ncbi:hypothetical protein BZL30_5334 [Mycobacterium kansasii]|uniref:DUF732 domain-containing protein n=1 Tax=Mycobacterium kansasii TaxID=1768 RepID=A0A1V3X1A5_MYCKA|nr:hypothetical protein BZL30_5334 [Mycobacterium kansasii]